MRSYRRVTLDNREEKKIDGALFEKIVTYGASNLKANIKSVNDLNVFPIPDGDTGDNMYMTIKGGLGGLKGVEENSVHAKAQALANGMLLNARGNSGVILSQFFAGVANGLESDECDLFTFANALNLGVKQAYSSVMQPVEGTILTVAREAAEYVNSHVDKNTTLGEFIRDYITEMKRSLERTPDLLPALKEAGVIDSGGEGLLCIAQGMQSAIEGREIGEVAVTEDVKDVDFSKFNEDSQMVFGYCTEFLLQLQNSKVDAKNFDIKPIVDYLSGIGDSLVAFKTGTVVKIHVHTMTPSKVLEFCQQYGEFLTLKIENMTLQHNETSEDFATKKKVKKQKKHTEFALVTVGNGEGLIKAFEDLGADVVIDGGQGKNPSIERFIEAFDQANADNIFVLPNNSNIIMAAKQAKELYDKSNVFVIETKNFGQAYSVLSMLDYGSGDAKAIADGMSEDMQSVVTGMVTTAIRDANIDGVDIRCGEYIGFVDKKMLCSTPDKIQTFKDLCQKLKIEENNFFIAVFGKDVSDSEKQTVIEYVEGQYPDVEFYQLEGGQDVYDFIMILE